MLAIAVKGSGMLVIVGLLMKYVIFLLVERLAHLFP
jgi:hypothetical protein